jgi:maltose O-acetyltransferase
MAAMTQKQKMLAGERYNFLDDELEADRQRAKQLMRRFNQTEDESEQRSILRQMFGALGENSLVWPPFYCSYGKNTYLGDRVFINYMCTILDNNEVRIGNHVMIGPAVQIYTAAHDLQAETRNQGWEVAKAI